jgi:SAM-dependent methyltransferase
VGAGRSILVDQLLDEHYENITLFDIADEAIQQTKQRLENRASKIKALIGDITNYSFGSQKFDLWHDRAVFHFLTTPDERHLYKLALREALKPDACFIIATFGPDGPLRCSNCETVRYSDASLSNEFGDDFKMLGSMPVDHETPFKTKQQFIYCWFRYQP